MAIVANAQHIGQGILLGEIDKSRDVFRIVLAIGVDRDGMGVARRHRGGEASLYRCRLPAVARMAQDLEPRVGVFLLPGLQDLFRRVSASVIDDENGKSLAGGAYEHVRQRAGIVVAGTNDDRSDQQGGISSISLRASPYDNRRSTQTRANHRRKIREYFAPESAIPPRKHR